MTIQKLLVYLICMLPLSCTTIEMPPKQELSCSDGKDFQVRSSIKIKNYFIFNDEKRSYRTFNLENNQFECKAIGNLNKVDQYGFSETKEIYQGAKELEKGEKTVKFFVINLNGKGFVARAEEICNKADLKYTFGIQPENTKIFGCQASKTSQTAVMFRLKNDDDNLMTIATIAIYAPIIEPGIN
jgi:myo-inositol-hexaphosphate 3-phosphohydrolase